MLYEEMYTYFTAYYMADFEKLLTFSNETYLYSSLIFFYISINS